MGPVSDVAVDDAITTLRERIANVETELVADRQRRARRKQQIRDAAVEAADKNSIGDALDDLLVEFGMEPRPYLTPVTLDYLTGRRDDGFVRSSTYYGAVQHNVESDRDEDPCRCREVGWSTWAEVLGGLPYGWPNGHEDRAFHPLSIRCGSDNCTGSSVSLTHYGWLGVTEPEASTTSG